MVCCPVTNTSIKLVATGAARCPGLVYSAEYLVREPSTLTPQPVPVSADLGGHTGLSGGVWANTGHGANPALMRQVRQLRDEQWRSVFGTGPIAPRPAHTTTEQRGVTGPIPWRRPA